MLSQVAFKYEQHAALRQLGVAVSATLCFIGSTFAQHVLCVVLSVSLEEMTRTYTLHIVALV